MSAISRAAIEAEKINNLKVINLFAGPGTGKSTNASYIFSKLKEAGINCEYVQEFAKDKTWEENVTALSCQPYVTGKQFWRLARLRGKVDIIVTDSPMILGTLYPTFGCTSDWDKGIHNQFKMFNNINIFLKRNSNVHPYNEKGRSQSEAEAIAIDARTKRMLEDHKYPYYEVEVGTLDDTWKSVKKILKDHGIEINEFVDPKTWMI